MNRLSTILTIIFLSLLLYACDSKIDALSEDAQSGEIATSKVGSPTTDTILDIATSNPDFSILADAVVFAGLENALDGKRQFTVFAPTNTAFAALLTDEIDTPEKLLNALGEETVRNILLYHVAPGERESTDLIDADRVNTLLKEFAMIQQGATNLEIGNDENGYANIVATDVDASNGVVHVIDAVLLPPSN